MTPSHAMLSFDLTRPREMELFAQLVAELQKAETAYHVDQERGSYMARVFLLNSKGERI
jgi:hypothetical protein